MENENEKEFEIFLKSKPISVPENIEKKVLLNTKTYMNSYRFKFKSLMRRVIKLFK